MGEGLGVRKWNLLSIDTVVVVCQDRCSDDPFRNLEPLERLQDDYMYTDGITPFSCHRTATPRRSVQKFDDDICYTYSPC